MSALGFASPGHHHKDAISSLFIGLRKKGGNLCVATTGEKRGENNSVIAHSTSQLVVCLPGSQFLFPPGGQHTTSALVKFSAYSFVLEFILTHGSPILGCPQQQDASLQLLTGASVWTEEDLPGLLSLWLSFPCKQAPPLTWGSDFLPAMISVTSFNLVQQGQEERGDMALG